MHAGQRRRFGVPMRPLPGSSRGKLAGKYLLDARPAALHATVLPMSSTSRPMSSDETPISVEPASAVQPTMKKQLERSLGLVAVVAVSISAMLGSGIFVLPGLAAGLTGASVWLAYLIAAVCVVPAAMCKAELATAMPASGGTYVYLDRILGPLVGTIAGLALWLSMLLKSAFALLGFGMYLEVLGDFALKPTALVLLAVIVLLNMLGVRNVSRAQLVVVSLGIALLAVLVVVGFSNMHTERLAPALPHGVSGLAGASAFVFVSYNGVTKIAAVAEEVKNPGRNVPLAIFLSLGMVAIIYCAVALTLVVNLPLTELTEDLRPIHTLAHQLLGPWGGYVAAVIGVATMTSMANAGLLAASRFPFAMSRDQLLPRPIAHLSSRFGTPVYAILLTGVVMGVAITFLGVERLAKLASAVVIGLYISVNAAVVLFRESGVRWYSPKYRAPFYPWLQGFGVVSGLFLLAMLGPTVVLGGALILLPGLGLFLFYGRSRVSRRGIVGVRGRRSELLQEPPTRIEEVQDAITGRAGVVVALFGNERGPETLVEVGTGLAQKDRLEVVHVTEVPEQLQLGDALREEARVRSLRRRFFVMAEQEHFRLDFHAIASRDIVRTVYSVTRTVSCDWLVIAWRGRGRTALLPYNPLGWLINHLDSNLALFRDAGVRYIREIIVYAEPGPHDSLVVGTADDLAQRWRAQLTLVRFVGDSAPARERQDEEAYLEQLSSLCVSPTCTKVVTGKRLVNTVTNFSAGYDLLVAGMPDVTLWQQLRGTQHEELMRRAECSVLLLKTPRVRTHEAYERKTGHSQRSIPLIDRLEQSALESKIAVTRKDALFQYCARVFAELLEGVSPKQIADALWERERTQNTSVGHGVALPHATLANAKVSVVGVFTTREPIDYQGPDGLKVDVFFVTVSPPGERQLHLQLLSGIAGLSLGTPLLERLRAAQDSEEMLKAIRECALEYLTKD